MKQAAKLAKLEKELEIAQKQAQIREAQLKVSDQIRKSRARLREAKLKASTLAVAIRRGDKRLEENIRKGGRKLGKVIAKELEFK